MAVFSERMERIRRDLIQRAHAERSDAMERGSVSHGEPTHASTAEDTANARYGNTTGLANMFSRPLNVFRQSAAVAEDYDHSLESPKSPQSTPTIANSRTQGETDSRSTNMSHPSETGITEPAPAVVVQASDPAQVEEPQPQQRDSHRSRRRGEKLPGDRKSRFLFCLPWIKSGKVRVATMHCLTSGLFVLLLLAVYLGLSMTQHIATNELTILLLLIIVISTVFFCYNVVRLCLAVIRGDKQPSGSAARGRQPMTVAEILRTGYAMPKRPIRVVLAQDEEAAGREEETNKLTPPAYGFWRESVRLDPNQLYWQRNEAARREDSVPEMDAGSEHAASGPRPPSYASDDGVSYVVNAMPSSTASTTTADREQPRH